MPRLIEVPNVGQVEFPDDMNDSQIARAIERDILKMEPLPQQQGGSGPVSAFFRGAGDFGSLGFGDEAIGGVAAPILKTIRPDLFGDQSYGDIYKQTRDTVRQQNAQAFQDHPVATIAGGLAGSYWMPGSAQTLAGRAGLSALTAGGYGFGSSEADTMKGRAKDAAPYAAFGVALPVAAAPVFKAINAIKGGAIDPAAQYLMDLGKKWGIRLSADDVSSNPALKAAGQGLEEIPFIGTRGYRSGQNQDAITAARGLASQTQDQMLNTQFENVDQLRQVAQSGGKRAAKAQEVLTDIANTGDDWQKVADVSARAKLLNNQITADKNYDVVEGLASKFGNVPIPNGMEAIDDAIQRASLSRSPDTALISKLSTLRKNLSQGENNYSQLKATISSLKSDIRAGQQGKNGAVSSEGAAVLQGLNSAVIKDMDAFAQANGPELGQAWKKADTFYRSAVVPYKDTQIASALKNAAPDEIYGKFITTGGAEGGRGTTRATKLYDAMDTKGRSAIRYGMVQEALSKASNADTGSFSPAKFASEFDRVAAAKGVFFKGADKAEIDGFKTIMRHVERSNVAINKPETGVKNIPYLIGGAVAAGGAYFDPESTAAVITSVYGLKKLLTTPAGRNFLLSSSKLKAGSPQMQKALDNFIKAAQLTTVAGSSNAMNNNGFKNKDNLYGAQP